MPETNLKLHHLKTILGFSGNGMDDELNVYLYLTEREIINWKFSLVGVPEHACVPAEDEVTQIMACAAGYGHKGAPDQYSHNENSVNRTFRHSDMLDYVRNNVIPYAAVR